MCACVYDCRCPWRPEEGVRSFGAGVTGVCELFSMGAGNLEEQHMLLTAESPL